MIIGYTAGVYDMFHIGHLNVLKNAKALCDYLIVAVSTDELVQEYKHKTPIIPFENRKAIVEAINVQELEKEKRNEIIVSCLEIGTGLRQLSRLTGVTYGVINKLSKRR